VPPVTGVYSTKKKSLHKDRVRAVFVFTANPLRSFADTTAYENAFRQLDLLVVSEIVMSETAALAHYVLPSKTTYESWDANPGGGISKVYVRIRQPVLKVEGEQKEGYEMFTLLADATGLMPEIPGSLYQAAESGNICEYRDTLMDYVQKNPENSSVLQFIITKTLGKAVGSAHLVTHFATFMQRFPERQEAAVRAGFAAGSGEEHRVNSHKERGNCKKRTVIFQV